MAGQKDTAYETEEIYDFSIQKFHQVDSTSNLLKQPAEAGAEEKLVITAESQTAGRGRKGRSFFSPEGKGLYFSILLRPDLLFQDTLLITTMSAVAVAKAVERISGNRELVDIKWVNDLFLNGKKFCGILTETGQKFVNGVPDYVIVGIGINTEGTVFPEELAHIATSLEKEWGFLPDRQKLLHLILEEFQTLYERLPDTGFMEDYRKRSMVIGRNIRVFSGETFYEAKATGIDDRAGLIIESEKGQEVLQSGEITIRVSEDRKNENK